MRLMQCEKEAKTTEADRPFGKSAQRRRFKAENKDTLPQRRKATCFQNLLNKYM